MTLFMPWKPCLPESDRPELAVSRDPGQASQSGRESVASVFINALLGDLTQHSAPIACTSLPKQKKFVSGHAFIGGGHTATDNAGGKCSHLERK